MSLGATQNITLQVERFIAAPPERVWQAWTDPNQVTQWLRKGVNLESFRIDLRVGGKYRTQIRVADNEFFTAVGTYLEVTPPKRLVYVWDWEKDGSGIEFGELEGNESQVTVEFHEKGTGTQLRLTHERLMSVESRERHQEGWFMWINYLVQYLEGND